MSSPRSTELADAATGFGTDADIDTNIDPDTDIDTDIVFVAEVSDDGFADGDDDDTDHDDRRRRSRRRQRRSATPSRWRSPNWACPRPS